MGANRQLLMRAFWLQLLFSTLTLGVGGHEAYYEEDGGLWGPSEVKRQGLIPFPRVGRSAGRDLGRGPEELLTLDTELGSDWAFLLLPYKRRSNNFTPRIGRKRRSVSEDGGHGDSSDMRALSRHSWPGLDWPYPRMSQQMIPVPRNGRGSFVPRLGKRRMGYDDPESWDSREFSASGDPKRGSFTPRIGRAAFTPRIGRTPFTPRIGRSGDSNKDTMSIDDKAQSASGSGSNSRSAV
ncbi:unnamed protein product [Ixodes persulcatus]